MANVDLLTGAELQTICLKPAMTAHTLNIGEEPPARGDAKETAEMSNFLEISRLSLVFLTS